MKCNRCGQEMKHEGQPSQYFVHTFKPELGYWLCYNCGEGWYSKHDDILHDYLNEGAQK